MYKIIIFIIPISCGEKEEYGRKSFISLENDFYNNAGIVMENGSDKASNGAFDDDPQKRSSRS